MVKPVIAIQKATHRSQHVFRLTNPFKNPIKIHLPRPFLLANFKLHPSILIAHPRQKLFLSLDLCLVHHQNHIENGEEVR